MNLRSGIIQNILVAFLYTKRNISDKKISLLIEVSMGLSLGGLMACNISGKQERPTEKIH